MNEPFEWLDHTADIQFRAYGNDIGELYTHCCEALFMAMTDVEQLQSQRSLQFSVQAEDLPSLLYELLDHMIYVRDSEQLFLNTVRINRISQTEQQYIAEGTVFGDYAEQYPHLRYLDVKSVTYHEMTVQKKTAGPKVYWEATVVLDI